MLDTIAGVSIGAFLLAVAVHGNSPKMVELGKRDRAFLKWAVAIGILYYLYNVPELREVIGYLIAIAFLGFGITMAANGGKFFEEVQTFWNSI